MADVQRITSSVESDDGGALLAAACEGKDGVVYIEWGRFISLQPVEVRLRLDGGKVQGVSGWFTIGSGKLTMHPRPKDFLRQLRAGKTLVARVIAYPSETVTATFDLAGAEEALAPVAAACGWRP
jgi:invasion protein IalB